MPVLQNMVYVVPKVSLNREAAFELLRYNLEQMTVKKALWTYPFPYRQRFIPTRQCSSKALLWDFLNLTRMFSSGIF